MFTSEKEKNKCLPFLDNYVEHTKTSYETSVYRKPTFTCQYVCWKSFTQTKQKISLILILVHCTLIICSNYKLKEEIHRNKEILSDYE